MGGPSRPCRTCRGANQTDRGANDTLVNPFTLRRHSLLSQKVWEIWWTWSGSNRRPLPCHGSALPAAPQAHNKATNGKKTRRKYGFILAGMRAIVKLRALERF